MKQTTFPTAALRSQRGEHIAAIYSPAKHVVATTPLLLPSNNFRVIYAGNTTLYQRVPTIVLMHGFRCASTLD